MKKTILLLLILTACSSVSYQEHTDAGNKYALDNGLTLITRQNNDTGLAAMNLLIKRSIAQDKDKPGLGFLTTRMLLSGTPTRTREQIISEIENIGGTIDANTRAEYAEIAISVPSDKASVALNILSDIIKNPTFTQEEFDKAKKILIDELRAKKDQPEIRAEDLFMATMYAGHPYQNPIDGYPETIEKITRDDVIEHYKKWYAPQNMYLAIVGNINQEKIVQSVDKMLGKMKPTGYTETTIYPAPRTETTINESSMILESFYIYQGYQTAPATHADFIPTRMIHSLLGSGSGSRLFYNLREKRGLAYTVYSINPSARTNSFIRITMISRPGVVNDSLAGINEQIEKIKNERVPEEELSLTKQKHKGFFALDHQKTADQANYLALYEMQGLGYQFDTKYPSLVDKVTTSDVYTTANKYLNNPAIAIVGPFDESSIQ
jgi:zinc protease